tara:strand:+ start:509 stop:832 length:324 start_codon:yes stop_codon:yes gene_type:complete
MSQDNSNFEQAQKIVNEARKKNHKTPEQIIDEKLERLLNLDLMAEVSNMSGFDEITRHLSSDEKDRFDVEAEDITSAYSEILQSVANALKDPRAREEILDELKRRVG